MGWMSKLFPLTLSAIATAYTMVPGSTCGVSDSNLRIVGGQDAANSTQFPWQGRFKPCYQARITTCTLCGASLISDRWLVSAAHCTANLGTIEISVSLSSVRLGGVRQNGADAEQIRVLAQIVDHPDYDGNPGNGADITLLRMQIAVGFTENLYPICLPKMDDCFAEGSETWISGFGVTEYEGTTPVIQQYAMVPISDLQQCRSAYGNFEHFGQVCAGYPTQGGIDACQGDSGGPLAVSYQDIWYLYGVTSYGVGCASPGFPGVYARVTYYTSWILNTTSAWITNDYSFVSNQECLNTNSCDCQDGAGETQVSDAGVIPGNSNGFSVDPLVEEGVNCGGDPCQNGGSCADSEDGSTYICTCAHEFTGTDCETLQAPGEATEEYVVDIGIDQTQADLEFLLNGYTEVLKRTTLAVFFYYRLSQVNYIIGGRKKRSAEDVLEAIRTYGCWCPRALDGIEHGHGGKPLDDVDSFCKQWNQCNHCTSMQGCGAEATNYTINFTPNADSYTCNGDTQCAIDLCTCNGEFATSVARYLADNNETLDSDLNNVDEATCEHNRSGGRKDSCCGSSPDWLPYNSQYQQCNAGILTNI